jgi:hypothetical protein
VLSRHTATGRGAGTCIDDGVEGATDMAELTIRVEGTPNPNAAKFTLDRSVPVEDSTSYFDAESASGDPLARDLFAVEGVQALLMVDNFITVTKDGDAVWEDLVEEIRPVLERHLG